MTTRRPSKTLIADALAAFQAVCGPIGRVQITADGKIQIDAPLDPGAKQTQDARKPAPWT